MYGCGCPWSRARAEIIAMPLNLRLGACVGAVGGKCGCDGVEALKRRCGGFCMGCPCGCVKSTSIHASIMHECKGNNIYNEV